MPLTSDEGGQELETDEAHALDRNLRKVLQIQHGVCARSQLCWQPKASQHETHTRTRAHERTRRCLWQRAPEHMAYIDQRSTVCVRACVRVCVWCWHAPSSRVQQYASLCHPFLCFLIDVVPLVPLHLQQVPPWMASRPASAT